MDTRFETSFIPQQPLLRVEGSQRRKEPVGLALLVSLVIFFSTIAVAGGVYYLKHDSEWRLTEAKKELDDRESKINIEEINALKLLSTRFEVAGRVLKDHVAFSALLDLLERGTSVNVGYTTLEYSGASGAPTIMLAGRAPSYMTVYVQTEDLRKLSYVKRVDVSTIALNETDGIVNFTMHVQFDQDLMRYMRYYEETHPAMPVVVDPGVLPPEPSDGSPSL